MFPQITYPPKKIRHVTLFHSAGIPISFPQKEPLQGWTCVIQMAVPHIEGDTPQIKKKETQAVEYVETIVKADKGQKPTLAGRGNSSRQSVRLYALIRDGIQWCLLKRIQ